MATTTTTRRVAPSTIKLAQERCISKYLGKRAQWLEDMSPLIVAYKMGLKVVAVYDAHDGDVAVAPCLEDCRFEQLYKSDDKRFDEAIIGGITDSLDPSPLVVKKFYGYLLESEVEYEQGPV